MSDVEAEIIEKGLGELVELITPQRLSQVDFDILDMDEARLLITCALLKIRAPKVVSSQIRLGLDETEWEIFNLIESKINDAETHFKGPLADAEIYLRFANALLLTGNVEKAERYLNRALEVEPHNGLVWNQLGYTLELLGRYEESIRCFERATRQDPNLAPAWMNKARAFEDLGKEEEALKALQRAVELEPHNHDLWQWYGNVLYSLGRFSEAKEAYEKAQYLKDADSGGEGVAQTVEAIGPVPGMDESESLLSKAEGLINRGRKMGADMNEAEVLFNAGKEDMEAGRYEQALEQIRLAIGEGERAIRKRVSEAIETAEKKISYAKVYVVAPKAELFLNRAKDSFEAGDYEAALGHADKAVYLLEEVKGLQKEASKTIQLAWAKISEAKEGGADVSTADALLKEARDLIKRGDYEKAKEFAEQAVKQIAEPKALAGKKCALAIMALRSRITEAEGLGIDVSAIEDQLQRADKLFEAEDFEDSMKIVEAADKALNTQMEEFFMKGAVDLMVSVRSILGELRAYEYESESIAEVDAMLDHCDRLIEEKEFQAAYETATKAHIDAQKIKAEFIKVQKDRYEEEFMGVLRVLKHLGADTRALDTYYETYKTALSDGEIDRAFETIKKAMKEAMKVVQSTYQENFRNYVSRIFARMEDMYRDVEELKVDDIEAHYRTLEKKIKNIDERNWKDRYFEALKAVSDVLDDLDDFEKKIGLTKAEKRYGAVSADVSRLSGLGVDTKDMENLLKMARMMIDEGDYEAAIETLNTIEKTLGVADARARIDIIAKKLKLAQEGIDALREAGVGVSEFETTYDHVRRLFSNKEYLTAEEEVQKLVEQVEAKVTKIDMEVATNVLRQAKLECERFEGTTIREAEEEIAKGEEAFKGGDYRTAKEHGERALEFISKEGMKLKAMEALRTVKDTIKAMERGGLDVGMAKRAFEAARPFMEKGDYDKVMEIVEETRNILSRIESEVKSRGKSVIDMMLEIQGLMIEIRSKGGQVERLEEMLSRARALYHRKEFDAALDLLRRCEKAAKEALELRDIIGELKAIRSEIDNAKADGIDVTRVEEVFRKAEPAVKAKNFEMVRKITTRIAEGLEILKKKKRIEEEMGSLVKKYNMLSTKGVVFKTKVEDFQAIAALLKSYKVDEAETKMAEIKAHIDGVEKKYLEVVDVISSLQMLTKEAKKRGLPTSAIEGKMRRIIEYMANGQYDTALNFAEALAMDLDRAMEVGVDLKDMLSLISIKVKEAGGMGLKMMDIDKDVEHIHVLMERGEFDEGVKEAEKVLERIEKAKLRYENLLNKTDTCKTLIDIGKKNGLDIARAQVYFDQSILARNRGNYDRAEELLDRVVSILQEKGMVVDELA